MNWKLNFLKQWNFRCFRDPCAANHPRKVGEEVAHITLQFAWSMLVAVNICLIFIGFDISAITYQGRRDKKGLNSEAT